MSGSDDLHGVTPWISNDDAERLLSGTLAGDADDLAPLNTVLNALRGPAEPVELVGLDSTLVAFGASVVAAQPTSTTARTRPMIKKLLSGRALAAIGAVTLVSAGAAAASGDVVPPSLSSKPAAVVSSTEVPDESAKIARDTTPATDETDAAELLTADEATDADATTGTDGQGPDANGPAKFGLCTAYAARTKHDDTTTAETTPTVEAEPLTESSVEVLPVPFQNLTDAAEEAGQSVAEFCADAVPGGSVDAPGKSGDNPSASAPGQSGDNPSATAPGQSDDNPSETAPGKPDDNPSGTAPGKSGATPGNSGGTHGQPVTTDP